MSAGNDISPDVVNAALAEWRQGDCVLGEHGFVHRFNPSCPLSPGAKDQAGGEADLVEEDVRGFLVVTQTCDIVRDCADRPFLEVVPLVEVDTERLAEVAKAKRPAYAFVPGLEARQLVADLDRVMTVEKPVVIGWERVEGCRTDEERHALQGALTRKRGRFAFPDDFAQAAGGLLKRLQEKHGKGTPEGRALRALREIRVLALPSWNAPDVEIHLWFIRDHRERDFEGKDWNTFLAAWLKLIPKAGRFRKVKGVVVTLSDLTGQDYYDSVPLDLDHLSRGR